MGVVYQCAQPGLDRSVAVKVLLAARHASSEQVLRFQREARAASRLTHPNVVHVYDFGVDGDQHYYVMEYVDGGSLDQLIGTAGLTVERTLRLLYPVARALQAAHEQGIIHRDIKPSNILLTQAGQPKLADFGLAKSLHDSAALSGSGDLIGTPRYMSPEQVLADPSELDARTDIYSLGAVMYELLTGHPPVDGANPLIILRQLSDGDPLPVRDLNPDVPAEVAAICQRAMARDKSARYATAGQLADAMQGYMLEKLLGWTEPVEGSHSSLQPAPSTQLALPAPRRSRRWLPFALAAVGLLLASGLGVYAWLARQTRSNPALDNHSPHGAFPEADHLVSQARELLKGPLPVQGYSTPRDRLKLVLDDLTAVLLRYPDDDEARLLRARAYRRGGEYLAAIEDTTELLRRHPDLVEASTERLLATYALYVLYLGNLNEPCLRPPSSWRLRDDLKLLAERGEPWQQRLAHLVDGLARRDYSTAAELACESASAVVPSAWAPDLAMLQADALFNASETAHETEVNTEGEEKEAARKKREEWTRRANLALRRGLEADPNHVGLWFLKADCCQHLAAWEAGDNEDNQTNLRRYRPAFETALFRLREATLRIGGDTYVAKAVLLSNVGRQDAALDQVNDALSCRPVAAPFHTFKAWLRMQTPQDGTLTRDEIERILNDLQSALDAYPDDFNPSFVRALLHVAAGDWEEARYDLRQCRERLPQDQWASSVGSYSDWLSRSGASTTEYLDATLDLLPNLSVPVEVRLKIGDTLLKRLAEKAQSVDQLSEDRIKTLQGTTHLRLARAYTDNQDKGQVLSHVRAALELRLSDLTPQTFRDDGSLNPWNADPDFTSLYAEFENK
jgi:serine/threonine protein kinase